MTKDNSRGDFQWKASCAHAAWCLIAVATLLAWATIFAGDWLALTILGEPNNGTAYAQNAALYVGFYRGFYSALLIAGLVPLFFYAIKSTLDGIRRSRLRWYGFAAVIFWIACIVAVIVELAGASGIEILGADPIAVFGIQVIGTALLIVPLVERAVRYLKLDKNGP